VSPKTFLQLGRVSNLPTVWSNVLTAVVLSDAAPRTGTVLLLLLAMTLYYEAGMFLNDAFDAGIDRRERPDRPIPRGDVSARTVFASGFTMLVMGIGLVAAVATNAAAARLWAPVVSGVALALAIVGYDRFHKNNPLSPLLMGACRVLVYVTTALCVSGSLASAVVNASVLLLCYLIGLTYAAKHEAGQTLTRYWPLLFLAVPLVAMAPSAENAGTAIFLILLLGWMVVAVRLIVGPARNIRRAIGYLIAGISLLDAVLIAASGHLAWAGMAVAAFAATLWLQRRVAGT
jgi:4-hydroxybenzoate polyprenyltransferase